MIIIDIEFHQREQFNKMSEFTLLFYPPNVHVQ